MIGIQYCDCSSGSETPLTCPDETVFCDLVGRSLTLQGLNSPKFKYR